MILHTRGRRKSYLYVWKKQKHYKKKQFGGIGEQSLVGANQIANIIQNMKIQKIQTWVFNFGETGPLVNFTAPFTTLYVSS